MKIKADYVNAPQWKEMIVKSRLPEELKCLGEIEQKSQERRPITFRLRQPSC